MTKYVSDTNAGKSISVYIVLNRKGEHVATVKAHHGARCLVNVHCHKDGFQHATASGGGYDKFTAALSGLTIDGHKMSNHCGERLPVPRIGFFAADYKPRKGWKLASYGSYYRLDSGRYVRRHSYDWQDMARAELPNGAEWSAIRNRARAMELEAAESGRLVPGYSDCYRIAGLGYLETLGYRVIQGI